MPYLMPRKGKLKGSGRLKSLLKAKERFALEVRRTLRRLLMRCNKLMDFVCIMCLNIFERQFCFVKAELMDRSGRLNS